jgi:hypothetical protein
MNAVTPAHPHSVDCIHDDLQALDALLQELAPEQHGGDVQGSQLHDGVCLMQGHNSDEEVANAVPHGLPAGKHGSTSCKQK